MADILLVDDDEDLSMITKELLEDHGYQVICAGSCEQALALLYEHAVKMVILDINLPDDTGFSFCKTIRQASNVLIIFISARTSDRDKINALELGGDDYLPKPYSLQELLARVNANMRRVYHYQPAQIICAGTLMIDPMTRTVKKDGVEIALSLREFDLLLYLAQHPNQVIEKQKLFYEVWGMRSEAELSTLSVHMRWLREKLEDDPSHPCMLMTKWGVGYYMEVPE